MSKETDMQQTLLQEDSHANHSVLREREEEQTMIATSGMKLLGLLGSANQGGLLEKMLKELLTSKTAWSSDRCKMIWKKRVSKSNVLLFQLQASVRGIKGNESGLLLPTPTQDSASERTKKYKQGGTPLPLAVKMYPTPSASCQMDVVAPPESVQQNSKGWSVTRVGTGTKFGAKLNDVVNKLHGGKLNPEFVEFLMGYPHQWTKIEPTE